MTRTATGLLYSLLALLIVGGILVFWAFHALPFQDLPGHAGIIAIRERYRTSAFDQQYFVLAEHLGPYTLFRTLGALFARAFGPLSAVRLLATLPVVATPLALLGARRALFGDRTPWAGFYGVTLSFGLLTLFGFASYLLAIALMLGTFALFLDTLARADDGEVTWGRELVLGLLSVVVFLAHGHAYLMLLGLASLSVLMAGQRNRGPIRLRSLLPSFALAVWIAWVERADTYPLGAARVRQAALTPHFQGPLDKLSLLVTPTLMTRFGLDAAVSIALWGLLGVAGWRTFAAAKGGRSREDRHSVALIGSAVALFAAFIVLPHEVGWLAFVDARILPVVLALLVLGVSRETLGTRLGAAARSFAPVSASIVVVLALFASALFQKEAAGFDDVLREIPEGAHLLNLPLCPDSDVFTAHPFVHYDKLAVAARAILPSDLWFHQGTALYPTPKNPVLALPSSYSESHLTTIDWPSYRWDDWDYALIRLHPGDAPLEPPSRLQLVRHEGGFWLYRVAQPQKALP